MIVFLHVIQKRLKKAVVSHVLRETTLVPSEQLRRRLLLLCEIGPALAPGVVAKAIK
jgi:hypothetical protein